MNEETFHWILLETTAASLVSDHQLFYDWEVARLCYLFKQDAVSAKLISVGDK
jgi:hypothetical protein